MLIKELLQIDEGEEGNPMSTTLQSIIEEFSPEGQQLIQSKAGDLALEMVCHAASPDGAKKCE